ncbi:hypothetical protein LTR97_007523 [Elasticomyces elasticus]|uniref:Uncharacterized protein n=1 Tax=Elasticomyces elasticus TaxID=574655 RepID=A0AAN7WER2_9PEZI|nr:hypothetical protein LTR97_007523 [Elasticomyces elasticus]KAK5715509.1 hypothetical protein LTR15_010154 [Elasticomyces elasticus]
MDDTPTPSSEGGDSLSDLKPKPLNFSRPQPRNFSRPKPVSVDSKETLHHDRTGTAQATRSISAFHNPSREQLPTEPRFSIDSTRSDSTISEPSSAASEFAWDGALGELRSRRRPNEYESNQRYTKIGSPITRSNNSGGSTSGSSTAVATPGSDAPMLASELTDSLPPPIPMKHAKHPTILKRTPLVQEVQRNSISSQATRGDWEDGASHHTMSVAGDDDDRRKTEEGNKWSSSEYDVSGLSASEIRKLRKKGINPALYAEMKAARKGKGKWVGPLVGNTFIG